MSEHSNQKLKFLYLWEILNKQTDDEHPINSSKLIEELNKKGFKCERKFVYHSIDTLLDYGVDIIKSYQPNKGFFIGERNFETAEVRLLIDAVLAAPFITLKKTKELISKLKEQLSIYQAKNIQNNLYIDNRLKFNNEEIFYTIDAINEAITKNYKVKFNYHHNTIVNNKIVLDSGKEITLSPYALIWSNDKYYVVGNHDKYDNLSNYRLDRIKNIDIICEPSRHFSEVSNYENYFDVSDYVNKNVNMYVGEQEIVELICSRNFLECLVDKFGNHMELYNSGQSQITAKIKVYTSSALIDWLLQNSDKVYVKSPKYVREQVKDKIKNIYSNYFNENQQNFI